MTAASYWHDDGSLVACDLCPHRCRIPDGGSGRCGARRAVDGTLIASSYGRVSAIRIDPIEKKPLFHYKPGSRCLSVGGLGCNMRCLHCQNHELSMPSPKAATSYVGPAELAGICDAEGLDTIAFTYNEPAIWLEYIRDTADADRSKDIVMVTNGLLSDEAVDDACGFVDAMNIDVKGFTEGFYSEICGACLKDVLRTCEHAWSAGVHIELTYLIIPGLNDSPEEIDAFCTWVRDSLSPDVPVHFTAFHPDNRMLDIPSTPARSVIEAREAGIGTGLRYVYCGNIPSDGCEDTICPVCHSAAVIRRGFDIDLSRLDETRCGCCGTELGIRLRQASLSEGKKRRSEGRTAQGTWL